MEGPDDQLTLFTEGHRRVAPGSEQLIVVRSAAHARERTPARGERVWTLRDLFEQVRLLGLLRERAVLDDDAHLMAAAAVQAERSPFAVRLAIDLRDLDRALTHAEADPSSIAEVLGAGGREGELARLFQQARAVGERLRASGRMDRSRALLAGVRALEAGAVPVALRRFSRVVVEGLVEPSELEVRALVALASRGLPMQISMPIDGYGRDFLTEGVEWVNKRFEACFEAPEFELAHLPLEGHGAIGAFARALWRPPLTPIAAPVRVVIANTRTDEAREIAGQVAGWRAAWAAEHGEPPRVAVAFRTVDAHASRVVDALGRFGVPTRRRAGPGLIESEAARLLLDALRLRREGAPRGLLLSIMATPCYRGCLEPEAVGRLARLLRRAVARTDVEDQTRPSGGYRHRLERLRSSLAEEPEAQKAAGEAIELVERLLKVTRKIPLRAGLLSYAGILVEVFQLLCDPEEGAKVLEQLIEWRAALERVSRAPGRASAREVDLAALIRLLGRALAEVQMVPEDEPADRAVEIVALPDLLGRSFDFVLIADAVHGRLPLADRGESLVSDGDRKLVNRAAGRRVLRLFEDDQVFEPGPVPPRQALEPLWFLGGVVAAERGLAITASARDDEGREVAPSSFLQEALIALGADPEARSAGDAGPRVVEPRLRRMQIAHALARGSLGPEVELEAESLIQVSALARAAYDRARFFRADPDRPAAPGAYSYKIDPELVEGRLGRYLGLSEERPLAPTRLEALAACPMRGFVEQLLRIDTEPEAGQDADARTLGTLAHAVLEKFYEERASDHVPATRLERADRDRLREIVDETAAPLLDGKATGHLAALRASISWLKEALIRSVTLLTHNPPVPGTSPTSFELKVGTRGWQEDPHGLPPVPIQVGERTLFIGGEIDRVDEGDGIRVVVDYKNTTSSAVERKLKDNAVLETHFQLPLYLRLLEHHRPSPPGTRLCAYLIPLREGKVKTVLGEHLDFARRVTDDAREDGLAAGIARVVNPLLEGRVIPNEGNHCKACRLSRVCRVPQAGTRLYDGPDPEEVL